MAENHRLASRRHTGHGTTESLDLDLSPGGSIEGRLLDDQKQPRAGVAMRIMLTEPGAHKGNSNFAVYATTDAGGSFKSEA